MLADNSICRVSIEQATDLIENYTAFNAFDPAIQQACKVSRPILVGFHKDQPACVFGFIPYTFTSDTAHLWMITTDVVNQDKLNFARMARDMIKNMLNDYPVITGYVTDDRSCRWIKLLGGELKYVTSSVHAFEFRR